MIAYMDERPPAASWIAGALIMLAFAGCIALPTIIVLGGGRYIAACVIFIAVFLYDWAAPIVGTIVGAGVILCVVWMANRQRGHR